MTILTDKKKGLIKGFEPSILVFCCNWCSYAGADLAGVSRFQYPPNIRIIRVMCSGRVDPIFILKAFTQGIDGVLVTGCHIGDCHYIEGNENAKLRMEHWHNFIEKIGIERGRFQLHWISASEGKLFSELIKEFTNKIKELGPNPLPRESEQFKGVLNIYKKKKSDEIESSLGSDILESDEELENIKEILKNANFCYDCNRCVNVCPLSHMDIFNPRQLAKDLSLLNINEIIENNNIWLCLTCGQCSEYCPMTKDEIGVNLVGMMLQLRQHAYKNSLDLESCQQCNTHDNIFCLIPKIMVNNPNSPNKLGFLKGTDFKIAKEGEIAYFLGCLPLMEDVMHKLEIKYTDIAKSVIYFLNRANITPVVLNEKCCGHDILWGEGDLETFKKLAEYNVELYKNAGVKTIICGCAEGFKTWKYDYPKIIKDFDFEVLHFTEFLLKEKILDNVRFSNLNKVKVTYHDPCRLGRLGGIYEAPREILKQIPNVELVEMQNNRENANCCGVSAFKGCNDYTKLIRHNRIQEAIDTGAEYLITTCPKCLTHLNCYLYEPSLNKNEKKLINKLKLIDLASFLGKRLFII